MKCAGHILRESFKSGFRPCHSVFIGGGHIFRPGLFTCDHFIFKYWRGRGRSSWAVVSAAPPPTGLMRTYHTHGGYHPHAKDLMFYFLS